MILHQDFDSAGLTEKQMRDKSASGGPARNHYCENISC